MEVSFHRILLVDDDLDEQFLTGRALRKAMSNACSLQIASSGNEAIAYMRGEGKFADRRRYPFPTLLITDLNMKDGDGFDLLEFIQGNPETPAQVTLRRKGDQIEITTSTGRSRTPEIPDRTFPAHAPDPMKEALAILPKTAPFGSALSARSER